MKAYDLIDLCPELDKYRNTIEERKKNTQYKIMFDHKLDDDTFAESGHLDWDPGKKLLQIRINTDFVNNYLGHLPGSQYGKLYMVNHNTTQGDHVPLYSTLGHELLHLWLNKGGSVSEECVIWSLEKKCLNKDLEIPSKCKCKEYTWDDCDNPPDDGGGNSPDEHSDQPDDNYSSIMFPK